MNYKKLSYVETDERGIIWDYTIILDKKLNCFRVFEGEKVKKDNESSFRYAINKHRLNAFNDKNVKEFARLTINNNHAFGTYNYPDGEFILA